MKHLHTFLFILFSLCLTACSLDLSMVRKASVASPIEEVLVKGKFPLGEPYFTGQQKHNIRSLPNNRFVFVDQNEAIYILNSEGVVAKKFPITVSTVDAIATDQNSNIYISGAYTINGIAFIEKYDVNGNVTVLKTFAPTDMGGGNFATNHAKRLKVDSEGSLYYIFNYRIEKYDKDGTHIYTIGTGITSSVIDGEFHGIQDFTVASDGRVHAVDLNSDRLQIFKPDGSFDSKFTWPRQISGGTVEDFLIDHQGRFLVVESNGSKNIVVFDGSANIILNLDGTENGGPGFSWETTTVAIMNNHYYVAQGEALFVFTDTGTFVERFYRPMENPSAIAQRSDGITFVASNHGIHKYDSQGQLLDTFGPSSAMAGIAIGSDNTLYYTNWAAPGIVKRFDANDAPMADITYAGSTSPYNMHIDSNDNLFIADLGGLIKIDAGTYTTNAIVAPGQYTAIHCNADGTFYGLLFDGVSATNIVKLNSSYNVVDTFPNTGAGSYGVARSLSADASGNVFVANMGGTTVVGYASDKSLIAVIDPAGLAALSNPKGVLVDSAGNILIADSGNHYVKKFSPAGVQLFQ